MVRMRRSVVKGKRRCMIMSAPPPLPPPGTPPVLHPHHGYQPVEAETKVIIARPEAHGLGFFS